MKINKQDKISSPRNNPGACLSGRQIMSGATLIEAMLAMVILAIVAVGGAGFLYYGLGKINIENNKRVAIEIANSRLEEMRASGFIAIRPPNNDYNIHYIGKQGSTSVFSDNDPQETVNINGALMPVTSTVQFIDGSPDNGVDSYDYLHAIIKVGYRISSGQEVQLETYFGKYK